MKIEEIVSTYPIISDQIEKPELTVILTELQKILSKNIPGDVIEMGCFEGTTSLFIRRLIKLYKGERIFHVYDSFAGLPEKTAEDSSPAGMQFVKGELNANKKKFILNFHKANLTLPIIHKAWFNELLPADIPKSIAFAFLDGDYYESIKTSLSLIEKRMDPNGIIVVDDYQNEALPGAKKATDEWAKKMNYSVRVEKSLAILTKP